MEIINPARDKESLIIKNFKEENEENEISFLTKFLVFVALFLALFLDILSVILGLLDLATIGIIGWILRAIFIFVKAIFFVLFWYLSKKYDYEGGLEQAHRAAVYVKRYSKYLIYTLRTLIAVSAISNIIPVIGAIIDALPIETLSVIIAFFVWPYIIKRIKNKPEEIKNIKNILHYLKLKKLINETEE
jgi:hypothetical protein